MRTSGRNEAILRAQEYLKRQPIYLDTETTGIGPNGNIVEIAIVDHSGQVLADTLVKPVGKIQSEAFSVHGISNEMVVDAPHWNEVWEEIEPILSGRFVGIYNTEFDLRMMQQSHASQWMQWAAPPGMEAFCIMKLYAQFYGQWNPRRGNYRWQSLDAAGKQLGLPLPNSHRAKDDTLLTKAILETVANQPG
jgi:DNA polymerase III epsilon subunit-like protein